MSQIVVKSDPDQVVKKNEPRRNFDGRRLWVHKVEYETNPGDYFKSQRRKANIMASTFEEARHILHHSMKGADYNIISSSDSELEVHAISPDLMKQIWKQWNHKYDPDSKQLRG
jgi:hypothetical protein